MVNVTAAKTVVSFKGEHLMANELKTLARKIKTAHAKLITSYRATLLHAKTVGELLIEAKGIKKRGWVQWLSENTSFSQRTAYNYMAIAEGWAEIDATAETTIPEALGILSGKTTPSTVQETAETVEPHQEPPTVETMPISSSTTVETSAPPTLPISNDVYLRGLMDKHGITGETSALLALLAEIGVTLPVRVAA